jgi:hypothetical protein
LWCSTHAPTSPSYRRWCGFRSGYARRVFAGLQALGIDYDDVIEVLESEGIEKFTASWIELLDTINNKMARLMEQTPPPGNQP